MASARTITLSIALGLCSVAHAEIRYVVRELAGPVGPANPFAINADGEVAGFSPDAGSSFHATRWGAESGQAPGAPGFTQTLTTCIDQTGRSVAQAYSLGGLTTRSYIWDNAALVPVADFAARSVNTSGVIVGSAPLATGNMYQARACVYANNALQILPTLGGPSAQAMCISESGLIVGSSYTTSGAGPRACVWIGGSCRDLGTLGGATSQALAISDSGGVVGTAAVANGDLHPFKFSLDASGQVAQRVDLGVVTPGSSGTAMGVSDAGDVVGVSDWNACLWDRGGIHNLNTLVAPAAQWRLDVASAINNRGWIVGWGMHIGQPRGFLLVPKCAADLDDGSGSGVPDGGVGLEDLLFYLGAYDRGDLLADLDDGSGTGTPDGGVTVDDLLYFLQRYDIGC